MTTKQRLRIRVRYPIADEVMVLRTEVKRHWDGDLYPTSRSADGAVFEVAFEGPYVAFKPCLRRGNELHWSVGGDYVLSAHDPDPQIWPMFFAPPHGEVGAPTAYEHEGRTYAVRVYTPPGYGENTVGRLRVLYMQDGKNLFLPEEAFAQEWGVDETLDRLDEMNSLREVIVVGITPADRMVDYTAPGYAAYGRFLVDTLVPAIDAAYRTHPSAKNRVVCGSSLGGVVSLYLAWQHPEIFGGAICLSSTFGYQDDLFARIAAEPPRPLRIYLDSGFPQDNFFETNAMRDLLISRGFVLGDDLLAFQFPYAKHDEASWAARVHVPLQFFFGRAWAATRPAR